MRPVQFILARQFQKTGSDVLWTLGQVLGETAGGLTVADETAGADEVVDLVVVADEGRGADGGADVFLLGVDGSAGGAGVAGGWSVRKLMQRERAVVKGGCLYGRSILVNLHDDGTDAFIAK